MQFILNGHGYIMAGMRVLLGITGQWMGLIELVLVF